MPNGPIRRAQLIAPFGVGSLIVVRDGISLIAAGLDHWYKRSDGVWASVIDEEFRVEEWRLSRQLGVDSFRQPPDYRQPSRGFSSTEIPNLGLPIPFLRFPTWHSCNRCGVLKKLKLSTRGKQECEECRKGGRYGELSQVPIIAMCEKGHIQDFPWREWVHKEINPTCKETMRLVSTGGASLASQRIVCACGKERSLGRVTYEDVLSKGLTEDDELYLCQGQKPWLGSEEKSTCDLPLRVSVRSASNVYYAHTASSIFIPQSGSISVPNQLLEILREPEPSLIIQLLDSVTTIFDQIKNRDGVAERISSYSQKQIMDGIKYLLNEPKEEDKAKEDTDFKREEFDVLSRERNEDYLKIRSISMSKYDDDISDYIAKINLLDKLRETRALYGFTRVRAENKQSRDELKALLRRDSSQATWLPAYTVYGEGILIELKEEKIKRWLNKNGKILKKRIQPIIDKTMKEREERELQLKPLSIRYFLLHTLAHLLIRQLTFECGYSAASLRERLYVSDDPKSPMAAVLIYTASGDSEGTMGGLVRMGKPGLFEPVLRKAITEAQWCSSDPICMEVANKSHQNRDSLAACHSCALLPETSCEAFNKYLDRALIVGDMNELEGFFSGIAQ